MVRSAIRAEFPDVARVLLEKVPGDLTHSSKGCEESLLGLAVAKDDEGMVKLLLDRGL